ncbi:MULTISPECIES: DMT family transporter [unclassified Rhodococcus (in: high G+C Gram-positive bacteria)]|uniref:EamA family transporter n=1 Tax=unclassified Rhodococcus (in: high G+C Gram-positive bacteria) TaxID=192944 RepID=UPI001FB4DE9B|nr:MULTISPECIES: DMT family transporter [unclassified Rhodococcus (in: high G+C Gram-positive bacteria)]
MASFSRMQGTGSAVAMIVGSCVSLQFGAALAVQIFPLAGSWAVTAARLAIAAVLLAVFVRPRVRQWSRAQWKVVCALGASLAAMNGSFYAAIERIPLGVAVSIEFLGPLVLAAVLSRRRVDLCWAGVALVGMAMLGIESAVHSTSLDPIGVLFALLAAGFWSLYILANARVAQDVPGTGGLAVALAVGSICIMPIGMMQGIEAFADPKVLAIVALVGLLSSAIPYSLELAALRRIPRNVFGVLLSLEPIFATLAGWLLLHQSAGVLRLSAIALVIVATVGTVVTAEKKQSSTIDPTDELQRPSQPSPV